ncbi:hypothetical protein IAU59_007141 [Kwoniella sp. CBS 9459]
MEAHQEMHPRPSSTTVVCSDRNSTSTFASANKPFAHLPRVLRTCLLLSPSFWTLNMGTGITSILLHSFPYNAYWLRVCGIIIFVLNVIVFIVLLTGNVVRYVRWKGAWTAVVTHPAAGMYWGCLPMGLATIVNMTAFVCVPAWGRKFAYLALAVWWLDVVLAIAANIGMLFMMFTRQSHTHQSVSSTWLLPIVASIVAAASGGIVAEALAPFDPALARSTVICSFVIWGTGVPIAMMMIGIWVYRCAVNGIPTPTALPSVFLPLGPCGQGSFGIALLGKVTRDLAYTHDTHLASASVTLGTRMASSTSGIVTSLVFEQARFLNIADSIYAGCLIVALILWGLGLVLYVLAMAITLDHGSRSTSYWLPENFSIGWLAYTFPVGVWATATTILARELDSFAFKVLATIISIQVILSWIYIFIMVVYKISDGTIFLAPELEVFNGDGLEPPLRFGSWAKVGTLPR